MDILNKKLVLFSVLTAILTSILTSLLIMWLQDKPTEVTHYVPQRASTESNLNNSRQREAELESLLRKKNRLIKLLRMQIDELKK